MNVKWVVRDFGTRKNDPKKDGDDVHKKIDVLDVLRKLQSFQSSRKILLIELLLL